MVLGTTSGLLKTTTSTIRVGEKTIRSVRSARNIGGYFEEDMKKETHVTHTCKAAWYRLHQISKIRFYITEDQTKTLVHAYVTSKLDLNNSLLTGITSTLLSRLQLIQNCAAKVIVRQKKHGHVTPILINLHWLPVQQRICFKILLLTYKAVNGSGPQYLQELLKFCVKGRYDLRSTKDPLRLRIPSSNLITYGDRSFRIMAPHLWNSLPPAVRGCMTINSFKTAVKTILFKDACNI